MARLAFLAAGTAVVVVLVAAGVRAGAGLVLTAAAGTAIALAGAWWFLAHRGLVRWLGGLPTLTLSLGEQQPHVRGRIREYLPL